MGTHVRIKDFKIKKKIKKIKNNDNNKKKINKRQQNIEVMNSIMHLSPSNINTFYFKHLFVRTKFFRKN